MKIHYTISTNSPYPIESKGVVDCSGYQIAAREAVRSHKVMLRERKKLRRWGETTVIKMVRLPDSVGE
jgi:hypothetical protein